MNSSFLINIKRILVLIRFDIRNECNFNLIERILYCIMNEITNFEMVKLLLQVQPNFSEQLIIKDGEECEVSEELKKFFVIILNHIMEQLKEENYDMVYDLVDMLHVFPDVIIEDKRKGKKDYWKLFVKPIIKKWDISKEYNLKKLLFK